MLILTACVLFLLSCGRVETMSNDVGGNMLGNREIEKGTALYRRGCYGQSMGHFFRAHEFFSASDDLDGVALSLNNIGNIYMAVGEAGEAEKHYREALQVYTNITDSNGIMQSLSNLSAALIRKKDFESAHKILNRLGDMIGQAGKRFIPYLRNKGIYLTKQKAYGEAEQTLRLALDEVSRQDFAEKAAANFAMGNLMVETGRFKEAIDFFMKALSEDKKAGFHVGIAGDLEALGHAHAQAGHYDKSADCFKRSIKIYALSGDREKVFALAESLAGVSEKSGVDTGVTIQFVQKWIEGEMITSFCE